MNWYARGRFLALALLATWIGLLVLNPFDLATWFDQRFGYDGVLLWAVFWLALVAVAFSFLRSWIKQRWSP
jgi:hypothetical protein